MSSNIQDFHNLHHGDDILFIGNAWDLLSALSLEKAGFQALGTTSWGIARTLGYSDGEKIDFNIHLGIIKSIVDHVKIPVSADIESGYGDTQTAIIENVLRTADLGVAGINIEDSLKKQTGLRELSGHCELLSKIRAALENRGYNNFYINARIDTYFQIQDPFAETISRAKAYVESGASGIFVPGLKEEEEIKAVAEQVNAPLNVLSLPGLTNVKKLNELGVKRFSFGNAFSDKVAAFMEESAAELYEVRDTAFLYE
ncbi:isocitrate lyase/PEP mutase family protein [Paenibacillus sedimenti]|uniref:Isocitrate lyase/phosphoenolpyruvate mutase family protein n=1 Tax=Paenibacillus sedimenti TaxID=2770274 RepID=A0A926KJE5_9BACL|nr:isocitrate lyase/phosphoenolpyruvate mutase family protein [Paenibacillus sedimenti]MBD0378829.1 isocitrate lyase/phosphoenolpyruvate mutase family protein [Paenibacillus sedimenti]